MSSWAPPLESTGVCPLGLLPLLCEQMRPGLHGAELPFPSDYSLLCLVGFTSLLRLRITHFLPSPSPLPEFNDHHLIQTLPDRASQLPAAMLAYIQSVPRIHARKLFSFPLNHKSDDVNPEF